MQYASPLVRAATLAVGIAAALACGHAQAAAFQL